MRSSGQRSRSLRTDHLRPDPEGLAADSAVPKQAPDGRDFVAVHANEDDSFLSSMSIYPVHPVLLEAAWVEY
jgi:hypothetical protein